MKHTIIFLVIISSLIGCQKIEEEKGKSIFIKFEVKNLTSKDLKLMLFRSNDSLYKKVQIIAGDSMITDEGFLHPAPGGPTYSLTSSLDSAIIKFSDGKTLIQTAGERGINDTINNILVDIHYRIYEHFNSENVRQQFIINESDYMRSK